MSQKQSKKVVTAALCLAVAFTALAAFSCKTAGSGRATARYFYAGDSGMWKHIYAMSQPFKMPAAFPGAIIIPHHDICVAFQNSFYKALSQYGSPSVIVLISPDHFEQGKQAITLPKDTDCLCPDGIITLDEDLIAQAVECPELKENICLNSSLWVQ